MVNTFLIIEARFYNDIIDSLVEGAVEQLEKGNFGFERVEVPGALEIPAASNAFFPESTAAVVVISPILLMLACPICSPVPKTNTGGCFKSFAWSADVKTIAPPPSVTRQQSRIVKG